MSRPERPLAGGHSVSRMEPLSLRIERDRGGDGRAAVGSTKMVDADRLSHPRESLFDQAERDRAAKARAHTA